VAFTVTTISVAAAKNVQVTAAIWTGSLTGSLTVNPASGPPAITITSFTLAPGSVTGGNNSVGTVVLSSAAPAAGQSVMLASNNTTAATVPAGFTIAAGATSGAFNVTTLAVTVAANVSITAMLPSGSAMSGGLTVSPPVTAPVVTTLSFSPASVVSGQTATGTVTLSGVAPAGGISVNLTSANPAALPVPASVSVAAGQSTQTFLVTAGAVSSATPVTVTATSGAASATASLIVTLALSLNPSSLTFAGTLDTLTSSPESVTLTNNSSSNVAITSIAASGGFGQANNCPATLAGGATCTIAVTFTPPSAGSFSGSVTVISTAADPTLTVSLSGTGLHWIGLSWTDSDATVAGYNVYRAAASGGPFTTKLNAFGLVAAPSYTDSDPALVVGTTYYYVVTAVNSVGMESAQSNQSQATFQ